MSLYTCPASPLKPLCLVSNSQGLSVMRRPSFRGALLGLGHCPLSGSERLSLIFPFSPLHSLPRRANSPNTGGYYGSFIVFAGPRCISDYALSGANSSGPVICVHRVLRMEEPTLLALWGMEVFWVLGKRSRTQNGSGDFPHPSIPLPLLFSFPK